MAAMEFVPTRASAANSTAEDKFKFVSYKSHKSSRNRKISKIDDTIEDDPKVERKGIDIKRARREIIKFGMSGFDTKKQQEAKVALAVSLGAKPPKNEYKNYKALLEQKKLQKRQEKSKMTMQQAGKNSLGVSVARRKFVDKSKMGKRKMNSGLLERYGKPSLKTSNNATKKK